MPFQIGSVAVHDDGQHSGTAKRDTASGVAGLDASGNILAPGPDVELTRDGNGDIFVKERTSGETVLALRRTGANAYSIYNNTVAGAKRIQDSSMKDVANGIAGLDASVLLALSQQRINFKMGQNTRDMTAASGNQAITGVGFTPRLVIFFASRTNVIGEMSMGWDDGTNFVCLYDANNVIASTWASNQGYSINMAEGAGLTYTGKITSLDADGFTIAWTRTGAKNGTCTFQYLALR